MEVKDLEEETQRVEARRYCILLALRALLFYGMANMKSFALVETVTMYSK